MITFHEALFAKDQPRSEEKLTKRELFAAMAMQGILSKNGVYSHESEVVQSIANEARLVADALIAELAKDPK